MKVVEVIRNLVENDNGEKKVIFHHGEYSIRNIASRLEKTLPSAVLNQEVIKTRDVNNVLHIHIYPDIRRHELY